MQEEYRTANKEYKKTITTFIHFSMFDNIKDQHMSLVWFAEKQNLKIAKSRHVPEKWIDPQTSNPSICQNLLEQAS